MWTQPHCTCTTSPCHPSQLAHKTCLPQAVMSLAVVYMQWLLVLTAVCLLLAELIRQPAKSPISNTIQELILLLSPHKFWWYVQHSAKAAAQRGCSLCCARTPRLPVWVGMAHRQTSCDVWVEGCSCLCPNQLLGMYHYSSSCFSSLLSRDHTIKLCLHQRPATGTSMVSMSRMPLLLW